MLTTTGRHTSHLRLSVLVPGQRRPLRLRVRHGRGIAQVLHPEVARAAVVRAESQLLPHLGSIAHLGIKYRDTSY